ncbi:hypothetical protein HOI26_04895 [Candidatus Woesearchaeota archaeon]|jgi:hypothetical protein|nr:hypothetical protein [Candidatus Woesearchaeota archaeon]MBT5740408.1 hypothetical protein [Candidatus Woesearchaeota archaeon]
MKPEDLLQDIQEVLQEPDTPPSKWRKPAVITISILLSLLMLSFIIVSYPIGPIIQGQAESEPLKNNVLDLGEFSVIFSETSLIQLQQMYFTEQEVEWSACLSGRKIDDEYHVTSVYQPKMFQQTFNHVSFEPCNQETLILLHTHPYKSCIASVTDHNTLDKMQKTNPDVLMIVMCESERFSVYR